MIKSGSLNAIITTPIRDGVTATAVTIHAPTGLIARSADPPGAPDRARRPLSLLGKSRRATRDPVQIYVSLPDQKMKVYKGLELVTTSRVSSGRAGYRTPAGVFSILEKKRRHYSNLYGGAPMPNMQRLTWSGVALHASGSVPGYPASHGCIRLPPSFARQLFPFTSIGGHVIVANEEVTPREFTHSLLPQPLGPEPEPAPEPVAASGARDHPIARRQAASRRARLARLDYRAGHRKTSGETKVAEAKDTDKRLR